MNCQFKNLSSFHKQKLRFDMAPSHELCFNVLEPAAYHVKPLGNLVKKKHAEIILVGSHICVSSDSRSPWIFLERASGPINSSSKNKRIHQAKPISLKSSELNQLQGFVLLKHGTLPWSGGKPSADRWKLQSLRGCFCLTFYWLWHPIELLQDSLLWWLPQHNIQQLHLLSNIVLDWKSHAKAYYEPWRTSMEKNMASIV